LINHPHRLEIRILNCNFSKGLRVEFFRICMSNHASYCDSLENSFMWIPSGEGQFDLVLKVKTIDILKAKTISEQILEMAALRGLTAFVVSMECCKTFELNWVQLSDFKSSEISPEFTPTPSVHSGKECSISPDVQLRMIENPSKSYVTAGLVVKEYNLAPRYKYKKFENDPMNRIFLTHNLHYPLDNSEIKVRDRGRSVAVPKMCFSLAKDEFAGRYENVTISKDYCGHQIPMTQVFLAVLFRICDEHYMMAILDLLKPGSRRDGDFLVTSVLIRHREESVEDFEDFVRENKKYSMKLWRKAPEDISMGGRDEYILQLEDFQEINADPFPVKRKYH